MKIGGPGSERRLIIAELTRVRKSRDWSQAFVAGRLGVKRQAVQQWESGATVPKSDNLYAWCRLMGFAWPSVPSRSMGAR